MSNITTIRKPDWLKVRIPNTANYHELNKQLKKLNLCTVCKEAKCPNIAECWAKKTLTIMIMGDTCTRNCRFCHVATGHRGLELDVNEPQNIARLLSELDLNYIVITSVTRDDLSDGGASHFAETIRQIKKVKPLLKVESLISDLNGDIESLKKIVIANPDVISHNVETVERLSSKARDLKANYQQSLQVLKNVKNLNSQIFTKSSLLVGLGESDLEIEQTLYDLRANDVDFLTIGQYLQPTPQHLPVERFVTPDEFTKWQEKALNMGFKAAACGALVRSSYHAGEYFFNRSLDKPTL